MATDAMLPSVSIVVPVYSGSDSIDELVLRCNAMRSSKASEGASIVCELIFVCDDPIDNSLSVLRALQEQYSWIKVVQLARNSGQHLATAVGMMLSTSDWVLTIDEDLQHPPEILFDALFHSLTSSFDIVYIKSTDSVHKNSIYRDLSSRISKLTMRLLTHEQYSLISSFRLVRGEIARSVAHSLDRHSYLDSSLLAATSPRRRSVLYAMFSDKRSTPSGYRLMRLIRHYGRLISAVDLSAIQILLSIFLFLILVSACFIMTLFFSGTLQGVRTVAPGWLSLFVISLVGCLLVAVSSTYILKLLSILIARSGGLPPFMLIDRDADLQNLRAMEVHGFFDNLLLSPKG